MQGLTEFVKVWQRPGFRYDVDLSGSRSYVFGCRAGPVSDVNNLAHEMAHVIQLSSSETKRIWKDGTLRFKYPQIWVIDRFCCEPETDQISRRELEAFVIQYLLINEVTPMSISRYFARNDIFRLFHWLPDYYHFHQGCWKNTREYRKFVVAEATLLLKKWSHKKLQARWEAVCRLALRHQ